MSKKRGSYVMEDEVVDNSPIETDGVYVDQCECGNWKVSQDGECSQCARKAGEELEEKETARDMRFMDDKVSALIARIRRMERQRSIALLALEEEI